MATILKSKLGETSQKRKEKEDSSDESVEDNDPSTSIGEIRKSMGFKPDKEEEYTADPDDPQEQVDVFADMSTQERLKKELTCQLCLHVLYKPVVTSCGHSFCRVCLCDAMLNMTTKFGRFNCPSCRKQFCNKCARRLSVQHSLWSTIQLLFPKLLKERTLAEEQDNFVKAMARLNGQSVSEAVANAQTVSGKTVLREEEIKLSNELTLKRTVVRDKEDYLMHLAVAVLREPDPLPSYARYVGSKPWQVKLALLELEEDEDEESGFPALLTDTEEDTAIIKNSFKGSVKMSVYQVDMDTNVSTRLSDTTQSISQGLSSFQVSLPVEAKPGTIELRFALEDEPSCCCSLQFMLLASSDKIDDTSEQAVTTSKYFKNPRPGGENISGWDTSDEEDSEFEDDGFVVPDDEPIELDEASSDEDLGEVVFVKSRKRKAKGKRRKRAKKSVRFGKKLSTPRSISSESESKNDSESEDKSDSESEEPKRQPASKRKKLVVSDSESD